MLLAARFAAKKSHSPSKADFGVKQHIFVCLIM